MKFLYHYQLINSMVDALLKDVQEFKHLANINVKEAYGMLLAATINGVYGTEVMPIENPILNKISEKTHRICEIAVEKLNQGLYGFWICEALREIIDMATLHPNRRYVIICDALGIHDFLLLTYEFGGRVRPMFAINPGGKTKTFEYMVKQCPILRRTYIREVDEPSLALIAKIVAQHIGASSERYDDFDKCVHFTSTKDFRGLVTTLYRPLEKLLTKVKIYLNSGFTVLMLADHGYDINPINFTLYHGWTSRAGLSLSILAPLLVVR